MVASTDLAILSWLTSDVADLVVLNRELERICADATFIVVDAS